MNEQIRVLLVEDNNALARMMSDMLVQAAASEFAVDAVDRLSIAVERISRGGVDLVLLDLALPDSQGIQTFAEIYNRAPELPIVVLTALEDETVALTALHDGAQDYLIKSEINTRTLIRAIRYAIERKRGEEVRSRLAAIVESSHDAIIGLCLEGLIVSWNAGAEAMFGHTFEEVIGRPSGMLLPAGWFDEMPALLGQLRAGQFVKDFESARLRKDGRQAHVSISVS